MSDGPSAIVYNNSIYCFFEGSSESGKLLYNVFDGFSWAGDVEVSSVGMSSSPSAMVYNNSIYCFHQGKGDNGQLWYDVLDTSLTWAGDVQVSNVGMSTSPSAVSAQF